MAALSAKVAAEKAAIEKSAALAADPDVWIRTGQRCRIELHAAHATATALPSEQRLLIGPADIAQKRREKETMVRGTRRLTIVGPQSLGPRV
eukprot:SAG11_NODE_6624_length_1277_cov_1.622241_1_plen_92_part_00